MLDIQGFFGKVVRLRGYPGDSVYSMLLCQGLLGIKIYFSISNSVDGHKRQEYVEERLYK